MVYCDVRGPIDSDLPHRENICTVAKTLIRIHGHSCSAGNLLLYVANLIGGKLPLLRECDYVLSFVLPLVVLM